MGSGGRESGGRELGYVDFDIEVRKFYFFCNKKISIMNKKLYRNIWLL